MDLVIGWPGASAVSGRTISALRTLVEHGKLMAQKDEQGRNVFAREDLEALREVGPSAESAGAAGGDEPAPGAPATVAPGPTDLAPPDPTPSAPVLPAPARGADEAEHAALVFAALDKGASLTVIVVEHHLPPDLVLGLHRKWRELKEVDLNVPSVPAMFERYQKALTTLAGRLTALERSSRELTDRFYDTPLPDRSKFVCSECGERGYVALAIRCGSCGTQTAWGFGKED